MQPSQEWKNKAKHKAEEILAEFFESHPFKAPISIRDVIESYLGDAQLVSASGSFFADGVSGFARKDMDLGWVIALNRNECRERQRFTAAHELGHIVLMSNPRTVEYCSDDTNSWVEKLCDLFAGHLLMPEALVRAYAQKDPSFHLDDIARAFKVSKPVAEIQLRLLKVPFAKELRVATASL